MIGERPTRVDQLLGEGQRGIGQALLRAVEEGSPPRAVLFTGPSGVGKTTLALMYASALLGEDAQGHPAVTHVDCADKSQVDFVREQILSSMDYAPLHGRYRIWFLDEVHGLSQQARHALFVRLENLPPHTVILAATTEAKKLEPMFLSRFRVHELTPPAEKEIKGYIVGALAQNGVGIQGLSEAEKTLPTHAARDIYERSGGNLRLLNTYLEQAVDGSYQLSGDLEVEADGNLPFELIYRQASLERAFELAQAITDYEVAGIALVNMAIKAVQGRKGGAAGQKRARAVLRHFGGGLDVRPNSYGNAHTRSAFFKHLLAAFTDD